MLLVAVASGIGCVALGMLESTGRFRRYYLDNEGIEVAGSIDTGFDGGAIGLGIISGVCFLAVVWIEVTRFKANK